MGKLAPFLLVMSVMFLSDAILADFAPGFLERLLASPVLMGLVMSCSSLAGITLDFLFAQLLKGVTVRKMMLFPMIGGVLFAGMLMLAREWPFVLVLVAAMAVWGIYYEFFGFATQQYVAEVAPPHGRASAWSYVTLIKSTMYMLGPLVGAWLGKFGEVQVLWASLLMMIGAYVLLQIIKIPSRPVALEVHEINLRSELSHWRVLAKSIWPLLVLSIVMGLIDAMFWTNGTIINDKLAKESYWGGLFVSAYMFPSIIAPLILTRIKTPTGKKRRSIWLVLASGIILALMPLVESIYWYLAMVLLASLLLSIAWPLIDAVYTDLLVRMGRERKHLIGLGNSTMSLAYVIGPLLAGVMVQLSGDIGSFALLGGLIVVVCGGLLAVTPRKLRLPQSEIVKWE